MTNQENLPLSTPAYEPQRVSLPVARHSAPTAIAETEKTILQHLLLLEVNYQQTKIPEEQKLLKYQVFCEDLNEYPDGVIRDAFAAYRRDPKEKFFPRSAQIRELCKQVLKDRPRNGGGSRPVKHSEVYQAARKCGLIRMYTDNLLDDLMQTENEETLISVMQRCPTTGRAAYDWCRDKLKAERPIP